MAQLDMSDYTGDILIDPPKDTWGLQTFKTKGTDIYPGMPVTMTGETAPEVVTVGTASDVTLGVVLCNKDHNMDEPYAAGIFVRVAMAKSGAHVWTWLKAGVGSVFAGTPIITDAGTSVYSIVGEGGLYEHVGNITEYSATDGSNDRPVKVVLS